jgi:hypothetical protein
MDRNPESLQMASASNVTSRAIPPARQSPIYTATSFACDRETRELGEDYPELRKIERAYRLLEHRLAAAQPRLRAKRALSTAIDFNLTLSDARHDASWAATLSLAREAFAEARVVKIAKPAITGT